jgi:folate-binding protein YgfZ
MQDFRLSPSRHELLRISGSDAQRFLQGQLTCDVAAVADGSFVYGAACNNKGRVIAPFILLRQGEDYLLLFRQGLAERFNAALRKFLPFYKCSMQAETALACVGLAGTGSTQWLERQGWPTPAGDAAASNAAVQVLHVDGPVPQYLLLGTEEALAALMQSTELQQDEGLLWQAAELYNGHYPFAVEDSEQFTPQELQYEEHHYISFTKGCYTGQEIVARMHYRGKPKKRLYRVEFSYSAAQPPATLTLLDASGSAVADCSKLSCLPSGQGVAVATLPIELADQQDLLQSSAGIEARISRF